MSPSAISMHSATLRRWLLGLAMLCVGLAASAQQDPPGRVARLNFHQGTISFAPAGDDSWYDAQPNRPITTGDRLWTDRNARAEVYIGSAALRLDGQTHVEFSELDDDTARITSNQGNLQLRVRDELAGQRFEVDTGNLAVVIDAPGEYRIASDPAAGTTWVAVASGRATLYGENGQSQSLAARQQLTVSGRDLAAVGGAPPQAGGFDAWVAERNRIEDQSVSARYVSREVVGYLQLDNYGDWQNDATYGEVWFPRNVDADWAPYRDGQWVNVAPWGLTWVDAAPWGFAPFHYGRWARVGSRWGWVPGRTSGRPVYSPALVGFVGGGANAGVQIGNGRSGVGWFPLAPGEQWRPGYHASQRHVDQVNRMAIYNRQAGPRNDFYANQQMPGAVTVLPADRFGRGPFGRRDLVRLPDDRFARVPVAPTPGVAINGFGGGFGRPAAAVPPAAALMARQQQIQLQQAQQQQQLQQRQQMEWQRHQDGRPQQEWRQQQDWRAQHDGRQRGEQERWQQQQQQQQQQAPRQQQEMQQRAAQAQAQAQQQQQMLQQQQQMQQQQRATQQQAQQQQQQLRQQQEMQLRAAQAQQQAQAQLQAQQNAMRQAQEAQLRAIQQQRGIAPAPQQPQPQGQRSDDPRRLWTSPDSR
ncbi:DUF6600 domain-containing protein [Variovorax sp. Varisp36]|uniref:DUF6600 domain-containing protein n=1 Tax=Variovorax sp. Varisp36 TaxID=3243031 RepID=UPI0039A6FBCE